MLKRICIALVCALAAPVALAAVPTDPPTNPNLNNVYNAAPVGQMTGNRNVIVLVHGWTSGPQWWPNAFRDKLNAKLGDQADNWDIWVLNWEADASGGTFFGPSTENEVSAQLQGQYLAKTVLTQGYDHIHLVGHSLGGRVIESAATILQQAAPSKPIHTTFMDAYTPYSWEGVYGETSTWSEHIVDTKYPPFTNEYFPNAFNVDPTKAKPPKPGDWNNATDYDHHWPRLWYENTIDNFSLSSPPSAGLGWALSEESGAPGFPHNSYNDGKVAIFDSAGNVDHYKQLPASALTNAAAVDPSGAGVVLARSSIDKVTINSGVIEMQTSNGFNEWVNLALDITSQANYVEFDYKFLSTTDGLLSFRIDNFLVWAARDTHTLTDEWMSTGKLMHVAGILEPGNHWLSYRLDASTSDFTADVFVRDISAGLLLVPEPGMISIFVVVILARRRRRF